MAQPQIRGLRPAMQYHTAVQQVCQPTGAAAVAAPALPQCSECSATSLDPDKVTVQALEANCPDPLGEFPGVAACLAGWLTGWLACTPGLLAGWPARLAFFGVNGLRLQVDSMRHSR